MKSVVKAFDKWAKRHLPNGRSDDTLLAVARAAYLAGRRDLQADVNRRLKFEAARKHLTSPK